MNACYNTSTVVSGCSIVHAVCRVTPPHAKQVHAGCGGRHITHGTHSCHKKKTGTWKLQGTQGFI
eukprot:1159373-Pelagomonas_calceolata.AAC.11